MSKENMLVNNPSLSTQVGSCNSNKSKESSDVSLFCPHLKSQSFKGVNYCIKCGVVKTQVMAYKSGKFGYPLFFDPLAIRDSQLKQRLPTPQLKDNQSYLKQRNLLIDFMLDNSSRMKFSFNTLHLGILFLDTFMSKDQVAEKEYYLYASTSLLLASKSIELDMKIPFISRLQRYTKLEFSPEEFKKAEIRLLKQLNWNLQCCTLLDFIETILSFGCVFQSDQISEDHLKDFGSPQSIKMDRSIVSQQGNHNILIILNPQGSATKRNHVSLASLTDNKIMEICNRIEKDYLRVANLIVRDPQFLQWNDNLKSVVSVLYLRKLCGLYPICPKQLQELIPQGQDIVPLFEQFVIQLDPIFLQTNQQPIQRCLSSNAISPQAKSLLIDHQTLVTQEFTIKEEETKTKRTPLGPCSNFDKRQQNYESQGTRSSGISFEQQRKLLIPNIKSNLIRVNGPGSTVKQFKGVSHHVNTQVLSSQLFNQNKTVFKFGSGYVQVDHPYKL